MGGTSILRNRADSETCVTLTLTATNQAEHNNEILRDKKITGRQLKLKILAVDDHPANRLILKHQLIRSGHQVVEAENGLQALSLWQEEEFDLIITDCNMPLMDGLLLTRAIRHLQKYHVGIVGLTADAQPEERARCLVAGMDECFLKPFAISQFENILHKLNIFQFKKKTIPEIEKLLDLPALYNMTQNETTLLILLRTTAVENQKDIKQAYHLLEQHQWAELKHCLHRLAGAAQIIGASQIERKCRLQERVCETNCPDVVSLVREVKSVLGDIHLLNNEIDLFIQLHSG